MKTKNLVRAFLLSSAFLILNKFANAQIVYTNIQPNVRLSCNNIPCNKNYSLDLNNDGVIDFILTTFKEGIGFGGQGYMVGVKVLSLSTNSILVSSISNAAALTSSDIIQSTSIWQSGMKYLRVYYSLSGTAGNWSTINNKYLGLKFNVNGQSYFGWVLLSVSVSSSQATVTIKSYAYDTTPNHSILAGATSGARFAGENLRNENILPLVIYPNPVSNSTTITFSLLQSENVTLKIYDVNGRLISILANKIFEEGENEFVWSVDELNAGIYFLQFQSTENSLTKKLIVTK
jgi:hypothetical protein